MKITVEVVSESTETYTGKKGLVSEQRITLLDRDPEQAYRMLNTMDYNLGAEERASLSGKLVGKTITIAVRDIMQFGGRLRIRGHIVGNGQPVK